MNMVIEETGEIWKVRYSFIRSLGRFGPSDDDEFLNCPAQRNQAAEPLPDRFKFVRPAKWTPKQWWLDLEPYREDFNHRLPKAKKDRDTIPASIYKQRLALRKLYGKVGSQASYLEEMERRFVLLEQDAAFIYETLSRVYNGWSYLLAKSWVDLPLQSRREFADSCGILNGYAEWSLWEDRPTIVYTKNFGSNNIGKPHNNSATITRFLGREFRPKSFRPIEILDKYATGVSLDQSESSVLAKIRNRSLPLLSSKELRSLSAGRFAAAC
jgi:hypothetical protein